MTTDTLVDATAAIQSALKQRDSALVRCVVLGQRSTVIDDSLRRAAHEDSDVGRAMRAFLDARSKLNTTLRQQADDAEAKVQTLAWPFLSAVFGAPMPGKVTLSSDYGGRPITENVVDLEQLHVDAEGRVSGVVKTRSDNGRSGDTRSFFTRGSRAYFAQHVSL